MKLSIESFEELDGRIGPDEHGALFICIGEDGEPIAPPTDLMKTDLSTGRFVQVSRAAIVDDAALDEMDPNEYAMTDPLDWPMIDGFMVVEIGRVMPGYTSGVEYLPDFFQLEEYLTEQKDMAALLDSDQWFALVFADVEIGIF